MIALFAAIAAVQVEASLVTQTRSIQEQTRQKIAQNIPVCITPTSPVSSFPCRIYFELKDCQ